MKKRYVISNTPLKLPIQSTIFYAFLLHYFQVSEIWWGAFIAVFIIYWILVIINKFNEVRIDLNSDKKLSDDKNLGLSIFAIRLNNLIKNKNKKSY